MTQPGMDAKRYAAACLLAYVIVPEKVKEQVRSLLIGLFMREPHDFTETDEQCLSKLDEVLFGEKR